MPRTVIMTSGGRNSYSRPTEGNASEMVDAATPLAAAAAADEDGSKTAAYRELFVLTVQLNYALVKAGESDNLDGFLSNLATASGVETLVHKAQQSYEKLVFSHLSYAHERSVASLMWMKIYYRIISEYRGRQQQLKRDSKFTQLRKLNGSLLQFFKHAIRFYRIFIQRLTSRYQLDDLAPIANKFFKQVNQPSSPRYTRSQLTPLHLRSIAYSFAHKALLSLGDLSRHRELLVPSNKHNDHQKKDWGPAWGYYGFARALKPEIGIPYNQMAVLSTYVDDLLSSTYYFYLAIIVSEPFLEAENNLRLGFKKLVNKQFPSSHNDTDQSRAKDLFLDFHAAVALEQSTVDIETCLKSLTSSIAARELSTKVLLKMTIINLAALHRNICDEGQEADAALANYWTMLFGSMSSLLSILASELDEQEPVSAEVESSGVPPVLRRILPSLRVYSKFILLHHGKLRTIANYCSTAYPRHYRYYEKFWVTFAMAFNKLMNKYPLNSMPKLSNLLDEDLECRGFTPVGNDLKGRAVEVGQETLKSILTFIASGKGPSRLHPNQDMFSRMSDLLEDAIELAQHTDTELSFQVGKFVLSNITLSPKALEVVSIPSFSANYAASGSTSAPSELFIEPYEDTELDMAFSLGDMVDSIVGRKNDYVESDIGDDDNDDKEEIVLRRRVTSLHTAASSPSTTQQLLKGLWESEGKW